MITISDRGVSRLPGRGGPDLGETGAGRVPVSWPRLFVISNGQLRTGKITPVLKIVL